MDFVPDPREVADSPICNAIERKDFKQALKLVEKRISKKPADGYLAALRCYIQCCHPLTSERSSGLATLLGQAEEKDATRYSQIEVLELYDEAVNAIFAKLHGAASEAVCKMRVNAVKLEPKDEKLAIACFRACLLRNDWASAETIAQSLENNFPSKHNYPFWAITAKWITSVRIKRIYQADLSSIQLAAYIFKQQFVTLTAAQKNFFSTLAYRRIKAYADATCKVGEHGALPPRSIQTPQELYLLHRLVLEKGSPEESLELYRNPMLGPDSKVAKGAWEMRRRQILLLRELGQWKNLFDICHKLLSAAALTKSDSRGSDWTIWDCYVKASSQLGTPEAWKSVIEQIRAHLSCDIKGRNPALAALDVHFSAGWSALQSFYDPKPFDDEDFMQRSYRTQQDLTRFAVTDTENVTSRFSTENWGQVSHKVVAICEALWRCAGMTAAFQDMKGYIGQLSISELDDLLRIIPFVHNGLHIGPDSVRGKEYNSASSSSTVVDCSTIVKIQYFIQSSLAESRRGLGLAAMKTGSSDSKCRYCESPCSIYCANCLESIASVSIKRYRRFSSPGFLKKVGLLTTDKNPADDMAVVAAMCLIKLSGAPPSPVDTFSKDLKRPDLQRLLQATALLEHAASNSKANPELSLLLVRLYQSLGAGSLAMRSYNRLGVKQIQGDTLGYVLFDRISSLHPHSVTDEGDVVDPSTQLSNIQQVYRKFRGQISSNSWKSFEYGNYDSIFQLLEVNEKLSLSAASVMSTVERRRIARITGSSATIDTTSHGYDILLENPATQKYCDNSDYKSFPNYECDGMPDFERYLLLGPKITSERCQAMLIIEELWMAISSVPNDGSRRGLTRARLVSLADQTDKLLGTASTISYTRPELYHVLIALFLVRIVLRVQDLTSKVWLNRDDNNVLAVVDKAKVLGDSISKIRLNDQNFAPTFSNVLHPLYIAHEIATLIFAVVKYLETPEVAANMKMLKATVCDPLTKAAKELLPIVAAKGNEARAFLNSSGFLDRISSNIQNEDDEEEKMTRAAARAEKAREDDPEYTLDGTIGADLTDLFGRDYSDFTEFWASELLDSWREASMGLACLKNRV